MPDYHDSRGNRIRLAAEVGRGGEGAVFKVQGNRGQVAKIWHNPTPRAAEKIGVMVHRRPAGTVSGGGLFSGRRNRSHVPFAWPDDVLRDDSNQVVGFLMPYVDLSQYRESQAFFNPAARRRTERELLTSFEGSDLDLMARNLAEAVRQIHAAGHVIGDVNEKNVLINARSQVIIVDIDAIQISDPASGRVYRCTVGREDYTPPRLQGIRFSELDREPNDDLFGLAVLIFKLIMGGYHPYMSRIAPDDEDAITELGEKIKNDLFPYNEDNTVPDEYKQPVLQYQENWDQLRQELKHLFCEAFDPFLLRTGTGNRPRPDDWIIALNRAIEIRRQQAQSGRSRIRRRQRNRAQATGQNAPPTQTVPTSSQPRTGQPQPQQTQRRAPPLSRRVRFAVAAGVIGTIALVTSCAFLGGLVPVIGSIGGGAAPPAIPTSIPVAAVIESKPTATPEPTPAASTAPTNTPLPPSTETPDISANVAVPAAAREPTATPEPPPADTPTPVPPTSTPAPTATPQPTATTVPTVTPQPTATIVPTPTAEPAYPDPALLEQRGSLPGQLSRNPNLGQYASGCFVGHQTRKASWFYLADRPSTTLEHARSPILLDYQNSVPEDNLRELLPGKCYYVGPVFYRTDQAERRCRGAVYEVSNCAGDEISQSFRTYVTDRPLREITEPPDFSN